MAPLDCSRLLASALCALGRNNVHRVLEPNNETSHKTPVSRKNGAADIGFCSIRPV